MQTESDLITKQDAEEFFAFAYVTMKIRSPDIKGNAYDENDYYDLRRECYIELADRRSGVPSGHPLHIENFEKWVIKHAT